MVYQDDKISPTFEFREPDTWARERQHAEIRRAASEFEAALKKLLPAGRETSLAYTKLEEATMWANKALSRAPEEREED